MASLNKVMLIGNLTRDVEVKHLPSGTAVSEFGMAINETYTKNGEKKETTTFVDLTAWGKVGEIIAQYCRKGSPLYVEGKLKLDQWEKDGQKRSKMSVTVLNMQLLGGKQSDGAQAPAAAPQSAPAAGNAVGAGDTNTMPF
jgi:single-strand DNA-binding protein